jgi:hypothetical protein
MIRMAEMNTAPGRYADTHGFTRASAADPVVACGRLLSLLALPGATHHRRAVRRYRTIRS